MQFIFATVPNQVANNQVLIVEISVGSSRK